MAAIAACINGIAGVKEHSRKYSGTVEITSDLQEPVDLMFRSPSIVLDKAVLRKERLEPGATLVFDAGPTKLFDFNLMARCCEGSTTPTWFTIVSANVVRTASYRIVKDQEAMEAAALATPSQSQPRLKARVEQIKPPQRQKDDRLADVKGISFSFSASGWLFMYQLGVAECLQDHGICSNPYVQVSGASGGALTAATMIYGCSMPHLRDIIKTAATKVHGDSKEAWNLRRFVVDACYSLDIRDGSYKHPAFAEGRVEICFSETEWTKSRYATAALLGQVRQNRSSNFEDTADVVVALLASCTMGISGMPFTMRNAEGKQVKVADSAFTSFLPTVDKYSVKVKPFSDGLGIFGGKSELMTSEFVPSVLGLYPAAECDQDHLYEMGYRDAQVWIEDCLDHLVAKIRVAPKDKAPKYRDVPERPPVSFECEDSGKVWQSKVARSVPVDWMDMNNQAAFEARVQALPLLEGELEVEVGACSSGSSPLAALRRTITRSKSGTRSGALSGATHGHCGRLRCAVTRSEVRWGLEAAWAAGSLQPEGQLGDSAAVPSRALASAGAPRCGVAPPAGGAAEAEQRDEASELGPQGGSMPVAHIKSVDCHKDRRQVIVNTYQGEFIKFTAASSEEAFKWQGEIKLAIQEQLKAAQEASGCKPDSLSCAEEQDERRQ